MKDSPSISSLIDEKVIAKVSKQNFNEIDNAAAHIQKEKTSLSVDWLTKWRSSGVSISPLQYLKALEKLNRFLSRGPNRRPTAPPNHKNLIFK